MLRVWVAHLETQEKMHDVSIPPTHDVCLAMLGHHIDSQSQKCKNHSPDSFRCCQLTDLYAYTYRLSTMVGHIHACAWDKVT